MLPTPECSSVAQRPEDRRQAHNHDFTRKHGKNIFFGDQLLSNITM
jgi:hypothetical protein